MKIKQIYLPKDSVSESHIKFYLMFLLIIVIHKIL